MTDTPAGTMTRAKLWLRDEGLLVMATAAERAAVPVLSKPVSDQERIVIRRVDRLVAVDAGIAGLAMNVMARRALNLTLFQEGRVDGAKSEAKRS